MRLLGILLCLGSACAQTWMPQVSGTEESLRGVSVASARVVWASGTHGTWLRTTDGGATWTAGQVRGAELLEFRGVAAFDERTALLMSSGEGGQSRIYKTSDGGRAWRLVYTNPDAKGFFDALVFRDPDNGYALGDPVDGWFVLLATHDGGEHWERLPTPPAHENEGAFAASNSSLAVHGDELWFGTGGVGGGRVFHSPDGGQTWTPSTTPVRHDGPGAGIFSLAVAGRNAVAVGGDFKREKDAAGNLAVSADGGRTWTSPGGAPPRGYRSSVACVPARNVWIATGPTGSEISTDAGHRWRGFDSGAFNSLAALSADAVWAVGPFGRIARLRLN